MFLLPCCLELFDSQKSLPESEPLLCRKVLLNTIGILEPVALVFAIELFGQFRLTANILETSFTLFQSFSVMVNAVYGICFKMRPSWRIVVIGPYRWSAVEMKRLIGWWGIS